MIIVRTNSRNRRMFVNVMRLSATIIQLRTMGSKPDKYEEN